MYLKVFETSCTHMHPLGTVILRLFKTCCLPYDLLMALPHTAAGSDGFILVLVLSEW